MAESFGFTRVLVTVRLGMRLFSDQLRLWLITGGPSGFNRKVGSERLRGPSPCRDGSNCGPVMPALAEAMVDVLTALILERWSRGIIDGRARVGKAFFDWLR
jgi:hypothetical protein